MSVSTVIVSITNSGLWYSHYPSMEMAVQKTPAFMRPSPDFKVSGLDPLKLYHISLTLKQVDNKKYMFRKGVWTSHHNFDSKPEPLHYVRHVKGVQFGAFWMQSMITFQGVKLTRDPETVDQQTFLVKSSYKYMPVLVITQITEPEQMMHFDIHVAQFFVSSHYRNPTVGKFKKTVPWSGAYNWSDVAQNRAKKENEVPSSSTNDTDGNTQGN